MKSNGPGFDYKLSNFKNVIIEDRVRIFHSENVIIGNNVYVGHDTIICGYYNSILIIHDNVWIGPQCYMHSAGGIEIQENVGIGPGVKILTSYHNLEELEKPIRLRSLIFKPVKLQKGCDIGMGAIINPGVIIGKNAQIGSGSVVTKNIPDYTIAVGNPARVLKRRNLAK